MIDMGEFDEHTKEKFRVALAKFEKKEDKLLFLDGVVAKTAEDSEDEILVEHIKKHADEFRKNIEGTGNNG